MGFGGGSIFKWPTFNIKRGRCNRMLSLGILSIFNEDVVQRVDPMLRRVFINPPVSFQLWSTMFSSWLSSHQLSLVFQPPLVLVVLELGIHKLTLFYILATTTLSEELGIYKPTINLVFVLPFELCFFKWICVGYLHTHTPIVFKLS
jgi:hypothetical protein